MKNDIKSIGMLMIKTLDALCFSDSFLLINRYIKAHINANNTERVCIVISIIALQHNNVIFFFLLTLEIDIKGNDKSTTNEYIFL
tara:strand:- start:511 stop:765 length:255 start_codon:yes stop_codon:yes gene_type:complete